MINHVLLRGYESVLHIYFYQYLYRRTFRSKNTYWKDKDKNFCYFYNYLIRNGITQNKKLWSKEKFLQQYFRSYLRSVMRGSMGEGKKYTQNLRTGYINGLLKNQKLPTTHQMVEFKRIQIKIKRHVKNKKH